MDVTGLGWSGTRTEHDQQLAHFYEHVLGLRPVHSEPGLRVFELPDGNRRAWYGLPGHHMTLVAAAQTLG
jgi:hypothetical protein